MRYFEPFHRLNPGDQEMRAQMPDAAAIENTDVLSLGQREQSFDKFICGKRNLVHSADFIMDRFRGNSFTSSVFSRKMLQIRSIILSNPKLYGFEY